MQKLVDKCSRSYLDFDIEYFMENKTDEVDNKIVFDSTAR